MPQTFFGLPEEARQREGALLNELHELAACNPALALELKKLHRACEEEDDACMQACVHVYGDGGGVPLWW